MKINKVERKIALDYCTDLGFTTSNTVGVDEIRPRALGIKGKEVNFDAVRFRNPPNGVRTKPKRTRVDLGDAPVVAQTEIIPACLEECEGKTEEFIKLDVGEGQDFETLNYNHKMRRKLLRAIENAELRKETLVRQRALCHYKQHGIEPPVDFNTPLKVHNIKGQRILEDESIETARQKRMHARMELAEYNKAA